MLTFAAFAPFGQARTMPPHAWTVLARFGFVNFTVALYLFLVGARHLAAAQAALIGTLEVVLAPFWVWLAFGESPSVATITGGGMIFLVVVWHHDGMAGRGASTPVLVRPAERLTFSASAEPPMGAAGFLGNI